MVVVFDQDDQLGTEGLRQCFNLMKQSKDDRPSFFFVESLYRPAQPPVRSQPLHDGMHDLTVLQCNEQIAFPRGRYRKVFQRQLATL